MDKIWKICIIICLIYSVVTQHTTLLFEGLLKVPQQTFELVKTLILSMAFWGGFLKIMETSHFMNYFSIVFKPLLKLLIGSMANNKQLYDCFSTNIFANLLGLGSLATLSGLKTFRLMYETTHSLNKQMCTLVIMNTAGFCLFPMNMLTLRYNFHSQNLFAFYPFVLIISFIIIIVGLCLHRFIPYE